MGAGAIVTHRSLTGSDDLAGRGSVGTPGSSPPRYGRWRFDLGTDGKPSVGPGDPRGSTWRRHTQEVPVHLLWNIIVLIVVGLIAGFIARAVIPGKQHMSIVMTIVLGIIGSLVGNLLGSLIFEPHRFEIGTSASSGSSSGGLLVSGVSAAVQGRNHRSVTR